MKLIRKKVLEWIKGSDVDEFSISQNNTWSTVAVAGAALVGGYIASSGAQSAASTQAAGAEAAAQVSQNEFNTITKQEQPFMQSGYGAINQLDYLLGIGTPQQYATSTTTPP